MSEFDSTGPSPEDQPGLTDTYFRNTQRIVESHGDCEVEYAVFMRRPVTYAGRLAVTWLQAMATHRGATVEVCLLYTSPSPRDLSTSRMPSSA